MFHSHLDVVLNGSRLHEEGVEAVLLAHPVDPCGVPRCVHARLRALHKGIHLLVGGDGRALKETLPEAQRTQGIDSLA